MNIGLLGCGVVGGGILDFCAERTDLTVTKVLVRRVSAVDIYHRFL